MDLDTLVTDADPVRRRELDRAGSAAAERLYHRITGWELPPRHLGGWWLAGEPARRRLGGWRPAGSRGRRRRWPAVLAGAAVLAAAAIAAGLLIRPAARPAAAGRAPVAAILAAAAVRAAHGAGASQPPGPGQYLYVKEVVAKGLGSRPGCAAAPMTVQAWVAADGSGRQIGTFPARCGKLNFDLTYRAGGLAWWLYGYVKAGSLPIDPASLQQAIVQRFEHGHSRPSATFVYAATFLNAGSPPALRSALYRVIEALPGVQNLGPVTDQLGRHGQGIGLVTTGARDELIFAPGNTTVLAEDTVAVGPPQAGNNELQAGTIMQYTLYVHEGVVSSNRVLPRPGAGG